MSNGVCRRILPGRALSFTLCSTHRGSCVLTEGILSLWKVCRLSWQDADVLGSHLPEASLHILGLHMLLNPSAPAHLIAAHLVAFQHHLPRRGQRMWRSCWAVGKWSGSKRLFELRRWRRGRAKDDDVSQVGLELLQNLQSIYNYINILISILESCICI